MPYDSDEEADYSKMDLVGLILTESYFENWIIDTNLCLVQDKLVLSIGLMV